MATEREQAIARVILAARLLQEYSAGFIEAMGLSDATSEPLDNADQELTEALYALDRLDYPHIERVYLPLSSQQAEQRALHMERIIRNTGYTWDDERVSEADIEQATAELIAEGKLPEEG